MHFLKIVTSSILLVFISACGGSQGFPPVITGVKVQNLQYGKTATIYLGGKDLRTSLSIDSGGACANPVFASSSTTDLLTLTCKVSKTGDFNLNITSAEGQLIYKDTFSVPKPQVSVILARGSFTLELEPGAAPTSVNNFLSYVGKGYYTSTLIHRVIPGFVIQGGGYSTGLVKKPGQLAPIELETNKGLSNLRGTLAMARTNLFNSASSEFFINLVNNPSLDFKNAANPGYAVFGSVVQGMDIVDGIAAEPTGVFNGYADVPLSEVLISLVLQVK